MYVPPAFRRDDLAWALELIESYPFGTLITVDAGGVVTTFLPMLARRDGANVTILGHVARANPHACAIEASARATVQFLGPHAYVSAAWYERPYDTVPTWNYGAVVAEGRLRAIDGYDVVDALSRRFEGDGPQAWRVQGLTADVLEANLRGIVAFELAVEQLHAKAKLSQNRTAADRARVIAHLDASARAGDRACAAAMRALSDPPAAAPDEPPTR